MPPCLFDNKARMLNLVIRIFVYFILLLLLQIIPNVSPIRSKREESKACHTESESASKFIIDMAKTCNIWKGFILSDSADRRCSCHFNLSFDNRYDCSEKKKSQTLKQIASLKIKI